VFNPTREQSRRFFLDAWRKRTAGLPQTDLEMLAAAIVAQHPEYHALLADAESAIARDWDGSDGQANPFLHLSMHLAIEEQLGIDQPHGITAAVADLQRRLGDRHAALHIAVECLGETLWRAQRDGSAPDGHAYVKCVRRSGTGR
jgi:hypothetical protein